MCLKSVVWALVLGSSTMFAAGASANPREAAPDPWARVHRAEREAAIRSDFRQEFRSTRADVDRSTVAVTRSEQTNLPRASRDLLGGPQLRGEQKSQATQRCTRVESP